jgi:hypothetical protein
MLNRQNKHVELLITSVSLALTAGHCRYQYYNEIFAIMLLNLRLEA